MIKAVTLTVLAVLLALLVLVASPILTKNPLFLAGLPLVGICLLLVFLKPHVVYMLILFTRALLDPILEKTKIGGGAGLGFLLNIFIILLTFLLISKKAGLWKRIGAGKFWVPFLFACALSAFMSQQKVQAIKLTLNLMTYACMLSAPFLLVNRIEDRVKWTRYLLWATILPVFLAYAGVATKNEMLFFFSNERNAVKGSFGHPNVLAFFMVFTIVLMLYILRCAPFRLTLFRKICGWIYLLMALGVLVLTETRSAWISCALIFSMYSLQKERKGLVILALGLGAALSLPSVRARFDDLSQGTTGKELNSMAWRVKLWQSSMPYIARRPLTGYGLGTFQPMSAFFFSLAKKTGAPAHNVYVELLFETGVLGLLGYVFIYLSVLKLCWNAQREFRGKNEHERRMAIILFWYVVGFMAVSFSDNTLYYLAHNWYLWFFVGLTLRAHQLLREPGSPAAPAAAPAAAIS